MLRAEIDRLRLHRPAIELGFSWLERHLPDPPARDGIVHSDVRNGNIVVGPTGLRAILDWEAALNRSDPMQDLAWSALRMWRFRSDALEIGGLAGREPLTAGYSEAGGVFDVDRFEWWKVAETLRWALGLAQQAESFLSGRVPNLVMAASGRRVSELEWDLLMQIGTPLTGPRRSRLSPPAHLSASVVP